MSESSKPPTNQDDTNHETIASLRIVLAYHEQTKHHPHRYARAPISMDWGTQPNPFRRYVGAPCIMLDEVQPTAEPKHNAVLAGRSVPVRAVDRHAISQLLYDSLALSAWKEVPATGARWPLRVNPSSGNLHPTEGYLLAGPIEDIGDRPAVYHYTSFEHALERRAELSNEAWQKLIEALPKNVLLIGLTSIYWRESWKYGERAFRYCQHDVGHAIGAIVIAAAALGWDAILLQTVTDQALSILLGVHHQQGIEAEHPNCLLAVWPSDAASAATDINLCQTYRLPASVLEQLRETDFAGCANILSHDHQNWPIIDAVSDATLQHEAIVPPVWDHRYESRSGQNTQLPIVTDIPIRKLIRQRRSAVAMDGTTWIDQATFYRMLQRVLPQQSPVPFASLRWRPCVHLALFVHRVHDIDPGLYVLVRDMEQIKLIRNALNREFAWKKPLNCPEDLELFLLHRTNFETTAKTISCHQDIASEGAFSLGMFAQFEPVLRGHGPWFYKRLFWETGMIGQVLYLESEAVSESVERFRSTGIGCFFDDVMHEVLGIEDQQYQSLYHFTVGGAMEDSRLRTAPPYAHRRPVRKLDAM